MSRRYGRDVMEPDTFVRHYEDVAQIIRAVDELPEMGMTTTALLEDMLQRKDITALPSPGDPALSLVEANKRKAVERAYAQIAPMFWGPRISLDKACLSIRAWIERLE